MSEEDLANSKTYISDFDITKHIVLDNESNYWYSAEYVDKMLKKQDKEIERLNNIINELEKSWKEEITRLNNFIQEDSSMIEINNIRKMLIQEREKDLYKLQELKGSDKE